MRGESTKQRFLRFASALILIHFAIVHLCDVRVNGVIIFLLSAKHQVHDSPVLSSRCRLVTLHRVNSPRPAEIAEISLILFHLKRSNQMEAQLPKVSFQRLAAPGVDQRQELSSETGTLCHQDR